MSHPVYKLTYFDVRGAAETTRFVFVYANVPFEDVRVSPENWPSAAFTRLVAKKYNLAGTTDEEQAHVDAIGDYFKDIWMAMSKLYYEQDPVKKETIREEYFKTGIVEHLDVLESHLNEYGKGKLYAPSGVTVADFIVAGLVYSLQVQFPTSVENRQSLKDHLERVNNLPGVKEWVAKRPQTEH
ncbi:putative Glutathione S-transferase 1 [Hypsibius exemplaris]|uniref:glutathione transferase n=1 Tax=Hypsibius exemplaris TaxID=2072580 RepID=A0A1W0X2U7_HYPEX|nr:putative Glutathione S-transferase 1 [Hypsibius exemplaris]